MRNMGLVFFISYWLVVIIDMIGEGFFILVCFYFCVKLVVFVGIFWCVNLFWIDSFELGMENLCGFSVLDRLEKNFIIKGVNVYVFMDEFCKSLFFFGIYFVKNIIVIFCLCSFNFIYKIFCCVFMYIKIVLVWMIVDKK